MKCWWIAGGTSRARPGSLPDSGKPGEPNDWKIELVQFATLLVSGGPETYHALYFPFWRA